jgi:peptidoglycan/LPS O-acetylase OafA/YrhL
MAGEAAPKDGRGVTGTGRRFALVDSMRAVAALTVLMVHTAAAADKLGPNSSASEYLNRLNCGVWIFFVISGFVLFRPFVGAHQTGEPQPRTGPYAWRRVLRIVPAFWVALAISGLLIPGMLYVRNIPWTFGFAQIYRSSIRGMGIFPAWTLCVEMTFYLFLPVYAWVIGRLVRRRGAWLPAEVGGLVVLFALSFIYKQWTYEGTAGHLNHLIAGNYLPGWLDLFSLGMGLAVLQVWTETRASLPAPLRLVERYPVLPWAIGLVVFWYVCTHLGLLQAGAYSNWSKGEILGEHYLDAVMAVCLVLPAVIGDPRRGVIRRFLGHRWVQWLGLVSYGIYLWQATWLAELKQLGMRPGPLSVTAEWVVFGFAGTIALGALSYYVVERPTLSLKRLVGGPRRTRADAPSPVAPVAEAGAPATALETT